MSNEELAKKRKAFIIAALRRATYRWPPRYNTMNAARVERGKYKCNVCKAVVGRKDIRLDHINPVVQPSVGFLTFDIYIERMFCDTSGFQTLCLECHSQKTILERGIRTQARRKLIKKKVKR